MNKKYKYIAFYRYFEELDTNYIKLTFKDIESINGFELPKSAYEYKSYWHSSETHTITRSWIENNWELVNVVLGEYIEFKRMDKEDLLKNKSKDALEYKIEVYLSKELIEVMVAEATKLGACNVGAYDHISSYYKIEGSWRPLAHAIPFTGEKNRINHGNEYKLELRCNEKYIDRVLKRIIEIHPYEQPLINVIKLENHRFNLL